MYDPDSKCPYDPDYEGKDMFLPIQGHVDGLYTDRELEHIRALYAEKVTMVDKWFGHLMNNIRTLGMEDDTLVILVSDHGSPMGKGEHGHGIMRKCRPWPYEELAHIPMIMRGPGLPRNRRVRGFVQSCDVAPTVVDWLGIGVHPSMQGHSLLPLAKGDVEKVREFAIAGYFRYSWSIITEDWSFIHWLKDDEKSVADARFGIYGKDFGESTAHILQMKKANAVEDRDTAFYNRAYEEHKKAATLDGEDQWTCTAAASSEVPARDELYCRKDDPFQLNNVSARTSRGRQGAVRTAEAVHGRTARLLMMHGEGDWAIPSCPWGSPSPAFRKYRHPAFPNALRETPVSPFSATRKGTVMSEATLLDSVTFDEWIKSHDGIVLFHKKLCPHCKVMRTVLGKATAERPDIQLASVDSEEQPDLMACCSVERVPTLIVCRNGAVAARKSGIMNPRELLAFYESAS